MIKIKKLRIKNFKSFKSAEIPFSTGFTAIAGANASGKSNVLDSLLFVFGATSLKMLRAGKLSDLINHDAREDYAKVEVEVVDGDKNFLVSRIIDSRGQSVLRLNGKKKTLNEVLSLLQELGIKPSGHNIVVQGDITRVIHMNAKQRREILDEVAGLAEFEQKKEESIRKLEQVEQRVKDATLVLNERVNYLNELEKEKLAAQQFEGLSLELKRSKATVLQLEFKRNKDELEGIDKKIVLLQEEIGKKEKQKNEMAQQEGVLEEKVQQLTQQMIEAGEKTYSTILREIEEKKAENSVLKEKIEEKNRGSVIAKEKIVRLKEERTALLKEIEQKKEQERFFEEKTLQNAQELQKLRGLIDEKSKAVKSKDLDQLEARLKEISGEVEKTQGMLFEKKLVREKIVKEKESSERMLAFLLDEQKKLEAILAEKNSVAQKLKEISGGSSQEIIDQKEKQLEQVLNAIHSFKSQSEHLSFSISKLKGIESSCPVCDQKIDKSTISRILEQKNAQLREANIGFDKKSSEKEKILMEKHELIHQLHLMHDLKAQLNSFLGAEKKMQEIRQQSGDLRQKIKLLQLEVVEAEHKKISVSLEAMQKQKFLAQEKIDSIKGSAAATDLNTLLEKFNKLNALKGEQENSLAVLRTQLGESLRHKLDGVEKQLAELDSGIVSAESHLKEIQKKLLECQNDLSQKEAKMHKAMQATRLLEEEKNRITTKLKNIEEKTLELEQKIGQREKEINELKISKSKNEIRIQDLQEESKDFEGVQPIKDTTVPDLKKRIPELESQIKNLGAINMKALERFEELKKEVGFVKEKADKLDLERKAVLEMIDKIELKKINVFMECFNSVSKKFSDIYFHFFGGEGRLSLSDQQNPTDGGLLIEAKYKEGTLKNIDAMSGGEKSLTALAFIFAIQSFDPAPFYIFDEVDAALDKENSLKLAKMVREISKNLQFISITHNDSVIKEADQIIGVALNNQKSSVIGLRLKEAMAGESTPPALA